MKLKYLLGAVLSTVVLATSSFAATLSVVSGSDTALPTNFDPNGGVIATYSLTTGGLGTLVKKFDSTSIIGNGLTLSDSSGIRITYLGSEAGATNTAFSWGSGVLNNKTSSLGDHIDFNSGAGLVDFTFATIFNVNPFEGGSIQNGVGGAGTHEGLSMAFLRLNDTNYLGFFGDGRDDNDLDDMVVLISAVPLPAGGLLLLSAFGGFAAFRRRKNKQA